MKKLNWLALAIVGAVFLLLVLGARAQAWTGFRSSNSQTVAAGETVDSTLFIGARNINIAGTVNGDLFCGAQTLSISGTVKGDVICGAQTINISGKVEGSVRIGAQTVGLTGSIGRSATIAAQTINTDSASRIGMDASFTGTDLNLNGEVGRDLAVDGNNANIGGMVGRDIKSGANKITVTSSAKVNGGIEYTSKDKISIDPAAKVAGKVTHKLPKHEGRPIVVIAFFGNILALIMALLLLITALIVTALLPQLVHSVSNQGIRRRWWVLLTGFAASFLIPVLAVLLLLTVIGIPLGILLLLCWTLIALSSGLFTAYYIGRMIWHRQSNPILIVLAGSLVLLVLMLIPYLGIFVMIAAFWIGSGMVLLELMDRYPKPKYSLK